MGNTLSPNCSLSIRNVTSGPTNRTDHYGLASMLLAFVGVIRFTSLAGLAGVGAIEHTLSCAEVEQPQRSPDHSNLPGACYEI